MIWVLGIKPLIYLFIFIDRATLADPNDGEILIHYAKPERENHDDRASVNFECAAPASPQHR